MEKIAVVYWSGTGNTQAVAEQIIAGMLSAGAEVAVMGPGEYDLEKIAGYDKIAFGCPAMGDEQLEEDDFEPMFTAMEKQINGKKIALFGSYDWNDGQWIIDWGYRVTSKGGILYDDGLAIKGHPDAEAGQKSQLWGASFVKF